MTHFVVPTVNIFIVNGGKLLLSRRSNTGWMDGHLCVPGGHVETDETPLLAAARETQEELGVKVDPAELDFMCIAVRNIKPNEHLAFEFILRNTNQDFYNAEPDKCSELVWVDINALPGDVIPDFRTIIEQGLVRKQAYIEVGY